MSATTSPCIQATIDRFLKEAILGVPADELVEFLAHELEQCHQLNPGVAKEIARKAIADWSGGTPAMDVS
jgi:hypothetical protein